MIIVFAKSRCDCSFVILLYSLQTTDATDAREGLFVDLRGQLVRMSQQYGKDDRYILAGGGNTSCKEEGVLYVKASGTQLATIDESGFVAMDMEKLLSMLEKQYPADDAEREAAALSDMMAARLPGQEALRPSVECILHSLFPHTFVLHLHPALVNGLTCGVDGRKIARDVFGDEAVWIPLTKPGYVLGKTCCDAFAVHKKRTGRDAQILFMQNHGVVAAADTTEEIDAIMIKIMDLLAERLTEKPDFTSSEVSEATEEEAERIAPILRMLYMRRAGSSSAVFCTGPQIREATANEMAAAPFLYAFTPDQIVYCKAAALFLQKCEDIESRFDSFHEKNGYSPKIVLIQDVGLFALGASKKEADTALLLFLDTMKLVIYSRSFGGPLPLSEEFSAFILGWEVENYRQKVALTVGGAQRMKGKICLITGAAQGFGEGIARDMIRQGANVVIADMNGEKAEEVAFALISEYGAGRAQSVCVDVADEVSVKNMVRRTVLSYGGLDLFVSCAGILIARGLADMSRDAFDKVTAVNYTGFFLGTKYACVPMKIQRTVESEYMTDIVEINSKSGLEGSKKNFAYAGSKFGGIGLTQSFALELAEFGIKVNAICPGNLLDGPLWSDPEKGLFRQYLEAGKVPGAKTVADVRRFYEDKVPLRRGCTVEDVSLALLYLVEQKYETGQALPVTGGQVMLN